MHDAVHATQSVHAECRADPPACTPTAASALEEATARTAALNALTTLNPALDGVLGDAVDVINNLTQGSLRRFVPGVPPGPRTRGFELGALPDAGAGNLGLPALDAGSGTGTITPVNDLGQTVASGGTGLAFAGGAFLASVLPIANTLTLQGGWSLTFVYRAPTGAKNSSKCWVSVGKRLASNYGITITETSSGALVATVEDPRQISLRIQTGAATRDVLHTARLVWTASTRALQWYLDGVASGAPATLGFLPEIGGGALQVGLNLARASSSNPTGSVHRVVFEATDADQTHTYVPVGPSETLSVADARTLRIDTRDIFAPVIAAGAVAMTFATAAGEVTETYLLGYAGYVAPAETLASYVGGDMPICPLDLGTANDDLSALVLTPPTLGKLAAGASTNLTGVGDLAAVQGDGQPRRHFCSYQPKAAGTGAGQNPAGSLTRGRVDLLRTQQGDTVRVTNIVEMNRPCRLNGGGEAWGHADDVWVPIHALFYDYDSTSLVFPTLDGETPTVTIAEVPAANEGFIRNTRTGPNLAAGATVPHAELKRLGWYKPGVTSVRAACQLRLTIAAPGAPGATETYALKITDAPRPAAFTWWEQATALYSDQHSQIRWASRGGDWAGVDGAWGAQPFATSTATTTATTLTIDATAMVKAGGPEFFVTTASTGTLSVIPGFYTDATREPVLRVTGGVRAGNYAATRVAGLANTDTTAWKARNTGPFPIKRGQALLLGFDGAGTRAQLNDAIKIELILTVSGASAGGGSLQLFRPAPQPPRPGPRISVGPTPTLQRPDLIVKIDTDAEWKAMLNSVDSRNSAGIGQPNNYTVANGCYYGGIPTGKNGGMSLFRAFFKADGTGYPVVRLGRMVGWHINYQPMDANVLSSIGVSGKSPGLIASGSGSLNDLTAGFGGRVVSGLGGYTTRTQRGQSSAATHASTSPVAPYLTLGDYNYFLSGSTNGQVTNAIQPVPRMAWVWLETVYATNTTNPDGTWANDGVFEMYVNGRKQCESRRLEWRVAGNPWLWDAIWFDEYNGGTDPNLVDRLWPFVVGPTYAVASAEPIAPPPGWNVPFVTAAGTPDTVATPYRPDF